MSGCKEQSVQSDNVRIYQHLSGSQALQSYEITSNSRPQADPQVGSPDSFQAYTPR